MKNKNVLNQGYYIVKWYFVSLLSIITFESYVITKNFKPSKIHYQCQNISINTCPCDKNLIFCIFFYFVAMKIIRQWIYFPSYFALHYIQRLYIWYGLSYCHAQCILDCTFHIVLIYIPCLYFGASAFAG